MLDVKSLSRALPRGSLGARLALPLIAAYQVCALLALLALLLRAPAWLQASPPPTHLGYTAAFYTAWVAGLIYLSSGLWVLNARRQDPSGRAYALFAASAALSLVTFFDLQVGARLAPLGAFACAMTGGALVHLSLVAPEPLALSQRYAFLRWLAYLPAPAAGYLALTAAYPPTVWQVAAAYLGAGSLTFMARLLFERFRAPSPIARTQARLLLWGIGASLLLPAILLTLYRLGLTQRLHPLLFMAPALFPFAATYVLLRQRLQNPDYLFSRALSYVLLSALAVAGYTLLVTGLNLILDTRIRADNPVLVGLMVLVLALALDPARTRLQRAIDQRFFRGQLARREKIAEISQRLTRTVDLAEIVRLLRSTIFETLLPGQLHIYVHDPLSAQYVATLDEAGRPTSDIRFPAHCALAQTLSRRQSAYFIGALHTQPRALQEDWARMSLLGAQLFIPLPGQRALTGWLALGPRRSGEPYTHRELDFLEALADQAALAIERAQVVANLERHVHQMNVLARVAQGVNITLAFDDLLELLYAQTAQVLPTRDFTITLVDEKTRTTYHAFFLEADERLNEREQQPLGERQGLAQEVIRTGRPLITDDYQRECRRRAVQPVMPRVYAWMGVPLNTSDATIGALCLGSDDPAVVYTADQQEILQAIADQAAGAIAKARLLEETERRARQLATLNEVAQTLSSTLELDPLLERILNSAVEILDCEAGSLFLIDEATGELVFKVTAGPVAGDLVGQRLPPGTGLVGRVAESGQPLIANDVHQAEGWSQDTDQQTGFVTQSMLVVPLMVKETPIGVLEVINKRDGAPFTVEEQELLTVFTGQAAVAIENARLYTLTDQALADRVEELSVMQRIDRELNASLEVSRTMRITLDWALRQSRATAGAIGTIEEGTLQIIASEGYESAEEVAERAPALPIVTRTMQEGSLACIELDAENSHQALLAGTQSQAAIPIRRETQVIGLLLLESTRRSHFNDETLNFLARLSDHAAIALSNARFYAEVQAANLAKSDFVSFVSHELKTPMTSIKGYADLLANGAVGPINEAQANFLSTIRSNVDRMATLVSDLADISRIEAGRLRLEFSAVPVSDIVAEVVRSTRSQVEARTQTLTVEIPEDLPPVWGDRTRLIQILTNLVSNANKYTPAGGQIWLRAEQTANRWDPEGAPEVVHITVQDTGIGISPEDQEKIFQKFFRSEDEKAREVPGTGLGLNITKNLVEMQGGRIWFESQFREGSTFHFTIPIVEPA